MKNHVLHALAAIIFIGSLTTTSYAQTAGDVAPSTAAACIDLTSNLSYGQASSVVTQLQQFLIEEGLLTVNPSGYFGNATLNAVKTFQTQKGILSSGYVGPITRAAIKVASGCTGATSATSGTSSGSTSGVTPAITFKVNGSAGPVTVAHGTNLNFTWSSNASVTGCRVGVPLSIGTTRTFSPSSGTAGSLTSVPKSLTPTTYQTLYGTAPSTANLQVDYSMSCSHSDPSIGLLTDTVRVTSVPSASAPATSVPATSVPTTPVAPVASTPTIPTTGDAKILSFDRGSSNYIAGQPVTLSWTTTNAEYCLINVDSTDGASSVSTNLPLNGSKVYYPTKNTKYTLTCVGAYGTPSTPPSWERSVTVSPSTSSTQPTIAEATTSSDAPARPNFVAKCTVWDAAMNRYKIWLTWNAVPGAISYPVRLLRPNGQTTIMGVPPSDIWNGSSVFPAPTGTSQEFVNAVEGTYTYWGYAWNEKGWSGYQQKTITCSPTASAVEGTTLASANSPIVLGASTQCVDLPMNLHRGYEGSSVSKLQDFLMSLGLLDEATGFYGDKTVTAVKEYQGSRGLAETGMVYEMTRSAIKGGTCQ